jgi:chromate transporter
MIPMLHADVVANHHWLTEREFLDGVAMGQVTPGPIMVTATFIGWRVAGLAGAVAATACIFAPSALLTILAAWQLGRLRRNPWVRGFIAGVQPAIAGLVGVVAVQLGRVALTLPGKGGPVAVDFFAVALCVAALVLLVRFKMDAALLILLGGLLGLAVR